MSEDAGAVVGLGGESAPPEPAPVAEAAVTGEPRKLYVTGWPVDAYTPGEEAEGFPTITRAGTVIPDGTSQETIDAIKATAAAAGVTIEE